MLTLYTFTVSHFSEKARWALDFNGLQYRDERLLPGPHMLRLRRLARRTTVPVLVDGSEVVQGSSAILDYMQQSLGAGLLAPAPERRQRSAELEALADRAFGRTIQCLGYDALLPDRETVTRLWTLGGPRWGRLFYAVTYPLITKRIKQMYGVTPAAAQAAKEELCRGLDVFDAELARAPYLDGEAPSRLDITVAALLAPLCTPPQYEASIPELPPSLTAFVRPLQGRPTWQHVLRMYRDHRKRA